jgi:hypothetical protein
MPFILFSTILFSSFYYFTFHTSYLFKNKTIEFVGSKNIYATKERVAYMMCRYTSIVYPKYSYDNIFNTLWSASLDPRDHNLSFNSKDPESIWGSRVHKTVFPLTGENVNIVPPESKGYLMDSTCNADTWNGNAYSYTLIGKSFVDENDVVKASVYCYVSKDFNGNWAMLNSTDAAIRECHYDFENKGKWQKLFLNVNCTKGETFVFLYFSKFGVTNFSSLKGHVIFAYPEIEITRNENSKGSCLVNKNFIREDSCIPLLNGKAKTQIADQLNSISNWSENSKYVYSGLLFFPLFFNQIIDFSSANKDPIKNLASKLISEDTTYYPYKANIKIDSISNSFLIPRIVRLKFGEQIFNKEFNWKQKIFGGGFNFLNWYGYSFLHDKTKSDWPHNPFMSVLLYSGIAGLLIYCFFIYFVFYYYIKYIKEYPILFIFFLISFFFTFFSGGSPFDPPIMGFFVILPFFIHSILKKDKPGMNSQTNT